ncbi:DUF4262 domain-containing protein [Methylomicrobium lacus]|uniref:DUF4262 domain-containing protein n=1 Tax=Methylomicrobium lacus TaxID=136992 RepID=UPI0035A86629
MTTNTNQEMRLLIEKNISQHGHHISLVTGGDATPRFAYTIGLFPNVGAELVFAGASFYSTQSLHIVINKVADVLSSGVDWQGIVIDIGALGCFSLQGVHRSWTNMLLLGALDYYNSEIVGLQIVPDKVHTTIDVPNLSLAFNPVSEPVWGWLSEPWEFLVPENSIAITNLLALQGKKITEVMRWEEGEWELFAGYGPDVSREDFRKIPLGTLLAVDKSLHAITKLDVGKGLWRRDGETEWHIWESRKKEKK